MIDIRVLRERRRLSPFAALRRAHERAVREALAEGAATVRQEALAALSHVGRGEPSRAGESPHRQSGRLRDSVVAEVDPRTNRATVGTHLAYGAYLEFGTIRMAPRPWLGPAFDAAKPSIRRLIADALRAPFGRAARGRPVP